MRVQIALKRSTLNRVLMYIAPMDKVHENMYNIITRSNKTDQTKPAELPKRTLKTSSHIPVRSTRKWRTNRQEDA